VPTVAFTFRWARLSKAIGAMGGYVCGSRDLIDFLYLRAETISLLDFPSTGPRGGGVPRRPFALLDSPEGEKLVKKTVGQYENVQTAN